MAYPSWTFTSFLACYALCMLAFARCIERDSCKALVATMACFPLTFCLFALGVECDLDPRLVGVFWTLHAVPSSCLWPLAFQMVHTVTHSVPLLVLWSVQGPIGDWVGCWAVERGGTLGLWACVLSLYVAVALVLLLGELVARRPAAHGSPLVAAMLQEESDGRRRSDLDPETSSAALGGSSRGALLCELTCVVVASASLKSATYFASNFAPRMQIGFYEYTWLSVAGTLLCAPLALWDRLRLSASLATLGMGASTALLRGRLAITSLGLFSSMASTLLSICICSDLSVRMQHFAGVTSVLDALGTVVAASLQMVPPGAFGMLQFACSATTCAGLLASGLVLTCAEGRAQSCPRLCPPSRRPCGGSSGSAE